MLSIDLSTSGWVSIIVSIPTDDEPACRQAGASEEERRDLLIISFNRSLDSDALARDGTLGLGSQQIFKKLFKAFGVFIRADYS